MIDDMNRQWKKLKEKVVFNGSYRRIIKRTFRLPNGKTHYFEILGGSDLVSILAITKERRVIIVHQYGVGPERMMPELPGGGIDEKELPKAAARRELLEETGYIGNLHFLAMSEMRYSTRRQYHFVATECERKKKQHLDSTEFIELELVLLDQFIEWVRNGRMSDIATAYLGLDYLKIKT